MKYCLFLLFFLNALTLNATTEKTSICYAGIDPAEVLFYLYLSAPHGMSTDDIIQALSVDLDTVDLDIFRIELIQREHHGKDGNLYAPITKLWGNNLQVTFNISAQTLIFEDASPLNTPRTTDGLRALKKENHGLPQATYQEVAGALQENWMPPLVYAWKTLFRWYHGEFTPSYHELENELNILMHLSGTYANDPQGLVIKRVFAALTNEQIAGLMNTIQAQVLYKKGNRYKTLSSQASITPLRENAEKASKLAQSAAINRILFGKPSKTLEDTLKLTEETMALNQIKEQQIYRAYLNQNKTGGGPISFTLERAVR